jgi:hypothetical protein
MYDVVYLNFIKKFAELMFNGRLSLVKEKAVDTAVQRPLEED